MYKIIESKYKDIIKEEQFKLKTLLNSSEIKNYNYNIDKDIQSLEYKIILYDLDSMLYNIQLDKHNNKLDKIIKKLKYIDSTYSNYSIEELQDIINKEQSNINSNNYISDDYIHKLYDENILLTSKIKQIPNNIIIDAMLSQD